MFEAGNQDYQDIKKIKEQQPGMDCMDKKKKTLSHYSILYQY